MGACSKRVRKVVKTTAKALTPVGVGLIGTIVGELATTDLTNKAKREASEAAVKAAFKAAKIDARSHLINLGIETAVAALKEGEAALAELGDMDGQDAAEADAIGD